MTWKTDVASMHLSSPLFHHTETGIKKKTTKSMSALIPAVCAEAKTKYAAFINDFMPTLQSPSHEGRIPYFYLDSLGHLTIGVGHLMAKHGSTKDKVRTAVQQIFKYRFTQLNGSRWTKFTEPTSCTLSNPRGSLGLELSTIDDWFNKMCRPAVPDHLIPGVWGSFTPSDDYLQSMSFPTLAMVTEDAVKVLAETIHYVTKGKQHTFGATHYQHFNKYGLTEDGVDALAFDDVVQKITEVLGETNFKDFDLWPLSVEQSVLDLAFQYGAAGLNGHTKFSKAIADSDWKVAADNVPGGVSGNERTIWRVKQLRNAASAKPLK